MRALVLADTPPDQDALRTHLAAVPDLVITLGDLDFHCLRPLAEFDGVKVGVYGNHCGTYMEELGIIDLEGRVETVGGLSFIGLGGGPRYKPSEDLLRLRPSWHVEEAVEAWPHDVDVIVTHCPPYLCNDHPGRRSHEGWHALRDYVEAHAPRHLLHGHTYPDPVRTHLGTTMVHYVHGMAHVELA